MLFWSPRRRPDTPCASRYSQPGWGRATPASQLPSEYSLAWVQLTESLFSFSVFTE